MQWILLTLFAACMQAVRTAGQKTLADTVTPITATMVRYLFGLPFGLVYLGVLLGWHTPESIKSITFNPEFFFYALGASILQIVATALLIETFRTRNFAVGTAYVKTEAMLTAILGAVLFAELLDRLAWVSIAIGVAGLICLNFSSDSGRLTDQRADQRADQQANQRAGKPTEHKGKQTFISRAAWLGLGSGLCFSLTSLFLRQASLSLGTSEFLSAAVTLVFMVTIQTVMTVLWIMIRDPAQFSKLRPLLPVCVFVGITSIAGSVGWFTAMTLQNPAYVKALGQVEFLVTLLITGRIFEQRINRLEALGMSLLIASVLLLLLSTL